MRDFVKTMKGLSDPNRAKIIKLLQVRELCVCHITENLGLAQSTTSKHLKILLEAGLISSTTATGPHRRKDVRPLPG